MPIKISFDGDNCPEMPTMVLATKSGSKHGVINNITDVVLTDSMSSPAELSFQVHKSLDGNPCVLWNELVDFKLIWCKEWDRWFSCEVSLSESGEAVKNITAYSLGEYELSQILLFDVEINTEDDIARPDYTVPTIFYDPLHPDSSLLHRILSKAPHYTIGHVDSTIERLQRTFSFSNRSIKDCFDDVAEEIGCLFVYDTSGSGGTLSRNISVYDLEQTCLSCGYRGEFTGMCPGCGSDNIQYGYGDDTAIFVSTDNLTQEISYTTDAGSVKNCFHLSAGDDLMTATIRACNPAGGSYLWYIPEEVRNDMTPELRAALASYDERNDQYTNIREYELDASLLAEYNSLINKYSEYNSNLSPITSPVIGYAALMQHYFDVLDFGIFLQTSLMPEVIIPEKTAESQAALITQSSMSPVAVSSLTESTSRATAESAIKTVVRALIDTARFSFTVNSESWNNPYWTGTVTVTSRTENEHGVYDSATSERMTLSFTDDYATYLRQVIDKKMRAADTDDLSISSILSGSIESLVARLGQYSYDCLSSMADCCQDVLNVLIDAGASNQWASIPDDLYTPYYNKLVAIQSEMDERADEILIVTGNSDYGIVGLQQVIEQLRSQVQDTLDLQNYLGETMWLELCSYRREEEYSNDNYVSDGLSNADLVTNALEFLKKARKEIFKSATLQHSISSTLSNLLTIDAFKPILSFFEVGNWIRVRVDEVVYRLRLLSYTVDFSNFSQIQVEFSDVTKNMDGTSDVSSLLGKASAMSSSFSYVQKQATNGADSKHILENWVANGLATTQAKIMDSADNQDIVWDQHGMIFRRYDPITEEYNPKQLKIVNSTMAITDDDWRSTKTAVGRFFYQDPVSQQYVEAYGINAETVVGKMILGQSLGIYNESGSMKFDRQGLEVIGTNNAVTINPNGTHLFNISKGASDILYVDSNGDLHIKGNITATGGNIGGFTIESGDIRYGSLNSTADSAVALSSNEDFSRMINGTSRNNLRFAIGGNFGVAKDGTVYTNGLNATGASITGAITATSFTINGNELSPVATSGSYNSLSDRPIPASTYITRIDDAGIKVHAQNNINTNYVKINAEGMDVVKSGSTIAHFGSNIMLGRAAIISNSNESYIELMDDSDIWGYKIGVNAYSGELFFALRDTTGEADGTEFLTVTRGARPGAISLESDYSFYVGNLYADGSIMEGHQYLESKYALKTHSHSEYVESSNPSISSALHAYGLQAIAGSSGSLYFGPNSGYSCTTTIRGTSVYINSHSSGSVYIEGKNFVSVIDDLTSRIKKLEDKK